MRKILLSITSGIQRKKKSSIPNSLKLILRENLIRALVIT